MVARQEHQRYDGLFRYHRSATCSHCEVLEFFFFLPKQPALYFRAAHPSFLRFAYREAGKGAMTETTPARYLGDTRTLLDVIITRVRTRTRSGNEIASTSLLSADVCVSYLYISSRWALIADAICRKSRTLRDNVCLPSCNAEMTHCVVYRRRPARSEGVQYFSDQVWPTKWSAISCLLRTCFECSKGR